MIAAIIKYKEIIASLCLTSSQRVTKKQIIRLPILFTHYFLIKKLLVYKIIKSI